MNPSQWPTLLHKIWPYFLHKSHMIQVSWMAWHDTFCRYYEFLTASIILKTHGNKITSKWIYALFNISFSAQKWHCTCWISYVFDKVCVSDLVFLVSNNISLPSWNNTRGRYTRTSTVNCLLLVDAAATL